MEAYQGCRGHYRHFDLYWRDAIGSLYHPHGERAIQELGGLVQQAVKMTPAPVNDLNGQNPQDMVKVLNKYLDLELERKYF